MAVVNVNLNNMINAKDSRWLQLEVCREFQRSKCSRSDSECKFAHPPANVEVQNGRVIACYDSIKGRCNREKPPCKYFHPPQHLKDQLLINGRNHLALKNALMLQMGMAPAGQSVLPGQIPTIASPYLGMPQLSSPYSHYTMSASPMLQVVSPAEAAVNSQLGVVAAAQAGGAGVGGYHGAPANKLQRSDRIENELNNQLPSSNTTFYFPAYPGMMQQYKRSAGDKNSAAQNMAAVYQQHQQSAANASHQAAMTAAAYQAQALMQLQQQPYGVPVSFTGHPPGLPRF